ncbi:hypothetical protein CKO12_07670 [Chromatium okenii]|uniref:SPOR domain-containing protein n=1 Tax=Chromatium okenii TaxID=61644 RepID=UPI001904D983|nr:SPOR domain-containing protein [Chromatium okenii]MBK1641749.1 hypothetical protein [Chromatium okenii]
MAKPVRSAAPKPAPPPLKRNRQPRSCVWWFLMGITLGAVGGNIISTRRDEPAATPPTPTAGARESTPAPVSPTFHFPQLLNDTRVEAADRAPPPPPPAPRPQLPPPPEDEPMADAGADEPIEPPPPPSRTGAGFVVQAGSFKNTTDAERRRGELARLGVSSSVQKATLPDGQTVYRVRSGVYATRKEAEQTRDLLKRNGKDAVAYPVK